MLKYFAADFSTARGRFKRAAAERGAQLQSYPIDARGPSGETLGVDIAYFGDSVPAGVLLVSSGIHGVEGFAGSALQLALINEFAATRGRAGVLLVHALNPYGFAHLRRANEHNVDLNRNCLQSFPGPANEAYSAFSALLHPPLLHAHGDFFATRLVLRALRYGRTATKQAIAGGQYAFPDGLFYGGDRQQLSIDIFKQILSDTPVAKARLVIHIDVHTGLGPYGDYQLLPQPLDTTMLRQLRQWFGDRAVVDSDSSASASYRASGSVRELSTRVLSKARVYALTLEFGTFSLLRVLRALCRENWLHHHGGGDSVFGRKVKAELQQCFCPHETRWRQAVLSRGLGVLQQALRAASESSS